MGLSTVMASTIVFYLLITAIGFMAGIAVIMLSSNVKAQLILDEIQKDSIKLVDFSYNFTGNPSTIEINLTNNGNSLIYKFESIDVIVSYDNESKRTTYYAEYKGIYNNSSEPGWYIKEIYDMLGNNINITGNTPVWKPHNTLNIVIVLPEIPDNSSLVEVTIATPGGGKEYFEFQGVR